MNISSEINDTELSSDGDLRTGDKTVNDDTTFVNIVTSGENGEEVIREHKVISIKDIDPTRHNEYLLKWGSRLELESVDLRKESRRLIQLLSERNQEKDGLIETLRAEINKLQDNNKTFEEIPKLIKKNLDAITQVTEDNPYKKQYNQTKDKNSTDFTLIKKNVNTLLGDKNKILEKLSSLDEKINEINGKTHTNNSEIDVLNIDLPVELMEKLNNLETNYENLANSLNHLIANQNTVHKNISNGLDTPFSTQNSTSKLGKSQSPYKKFPNKNKKRTTSNSQASSKITKKRSYTTIDTSDNRITRSRKNLKNIDISQLTHNNLKQYKKSQTTREDHNRALSQIDKVQAYISKLSDNLNNNNHDNIENWLRRNDVGKFQDKNNRVLLYSDEIPSQDEVNDYYL
ncbi:hypothetical protein PACTADRAFT_14935 [Pachysolen tannophilus NRRL Y-2460]|uniref:Uncharacterized protein n=1 Tax=Pachysolen tannophilus NRRL Y-2460 TaxID=669874 RepID=A0A1E4U3C3_PACTA|nr:hypothetical protein PACTADRAFT_14935 [Pachysolen tannophilus NRRL Y-2460]